MALGVLGIIVGILISVILFLIPHRTIIFTWDTFELSNVSLLILFSVILVLLVTFLAFRLHGRSNSEHEYAGNKRDLQAMMLIIVLATVVSVSILFFITMNAVTASVFSSAILILSLFLLFKALNNM